MNRVGIKAEDEATAYLLSHFYSVLMRNFRSKYGEIDIIARKNNHLICVEVKSLQSRSHSIPALRVNRVKFHKIHMCYEAFISQNPIYKDFPVYVDIISIVLSQKGHVELEHYMNIDMTDIS